MQIAIYVLATLVTAAGVALLVTAYRHGQAGRSAQERKVFAAAVAVLALGTVLYLVGTAATIRG